MRKIIPGFPFKHNGVDFIILDELEFGVLAITEELVYKSIEFNTHGNNDWRKSNVRKMLNSEFANKLGTHNLVPMEVDLTADTGEDNYGIVEDYVSIPNDVMLRKYYKLIPSYNTWIWSSTPWSIEIGNGSYVSARGGNKAIYSEKAEKQLGVAAVCLFDKSLFE